MKYTDSNMLATASRFFEHLLDAVHQFPDTSPCNGVQSVLRARSAFLTSTTWAVPLTKKIPPLQGPCHQSNRHSTPLHHCANILESTFGGLTGRSSVSLTGMRIAVASARCDTRSSPLECSGWTRKYTTVSTTATSMVVLSLIHRASTLHCDFCAPQLSNGSFCASPLDGSRTRSPAELLDRCLA